MAQFPIEGEWPTASQSPASLASVWPLMLPFPFEQPSTIVVSAQIVEDWVGSFGVTVATGVSSWVGQKAGTSASQGTGASQPAYAASDPAFNGQPTITSDGVDDSLNSALTVPFPGTTPRYYWFVFRPTSAAAPATSNVLFCGKTNFCQDVVQLNTTGNHQMFNGTPSAPIASTTQAKIGEASFSNATTDFFTYGPVTVTGTNTGNSQDGSGWGMFSHGGVDSFWAGTLGQLFICAGAPTAAERRKMAMYSARRFGAGTAA